MRHLLLLLLLVPAACGSEVDVVPGDSGTDVPVGEFVTDSLPEPFGAADRARVRFADGEVAFSATCNSMVAPARVVDGVLEVDEVGGTEMGCPGAGHDQDAWLVRFFTDRPRVARTGDGWSLATADTELRLVPADDLPDQGPAAPLEGTRWRLTGIEEVDGDAVSLRRVPGSEAHLEVGEGSIGFDTGCNTGGGNVTVVDEVLRLSEVVTTLRACDDERGEVERSVMAVLGRDRVTWRIVGQELRLTAGKVTLHYRAG